MTVESATYINGLNAANPGPADAKSEGDDHLRLLKSTIKATFPNVAGAVSASDVELSLMRGATTQPAMKDGSNLTTPTTGDNSTKIATTAFVAQQVLAATLPGQAGNGGKFLATDGAVASWSLVAGNSLYLNSTFGGF